MLLFCRFQVSLLIQQILNVFLVFVVLVCDILYLLVMTTPRVLDFCVKPSLHFGLLKKHFLSNFI
jgi:hypothetical protein